MKIIRTLLIFLVACTSPNSSDNIIDSQLEAYFSSIFDADSPGASIILLKNEEVLFQKSYGLADLVSQEPIDAGTLFNLGSISKPFVAYGILILEDEGKLSLQDPLSKYFSEFTTPAFAERINIRHLLTHTSGLPDIRNVAEDSVFFLTAKDEENWAPVMKTDYLLFEPGEQYEYSNPAFNALALIIEKVSGMRWQTFIEERIFKPSGMHSSTITDGPHPETGVSHGYSKIGGQWQEDDYGEEPTFAAAGNGGVWSSINELVHYSKAMKNSAFLSNEQMLRSYTIQEFDNWKSDKKPFIGLSWFIEETKEGLKTISHTGTQGGFYCHFVSIPEKHILYMLLANRKYPREESFEKVLDILRQQNWLE